MNEKKQRSNLTTCLMVVFIFAGLGVLSLCCFFTMGPTVGTVLSGIREGLEESGPAGTPRPTPTPNIAPLYATIEAEYSSMTDVQQEAYFDSLAGAEVVEWEGTIKDVVKVVGFYNVLVNTSDSSLVADVYLMNIPGDDALNLNLGDTIIFSGKIQNVEEILSPVVYVVDVTIHQTEGD